jgi:DNA recombination protein RmuC
MIHEHHLLWSILAATLGTALLSFVSLVRSFREDRGGSREVREELRAGREEFRASGKDLREEVALRMKSSSELMALTLEALAKAQQTQLERMSTQIKEFTEFSQRALDRIKNTMDERVRELQEGNEKKLEEMRQTVDEKLHHTLEKRLGMSFKLVSDRLEAVHKGLGEMQHLAAGVGDLKRVLTNVKVRGTWAEVQLGAILEQILTPEQYEKNVAVKPESSERVEFAIRLPGPKDDPERPVWLPIDSKFPQEDYLRLQEAAEKADPAAVQLAASALARTVRLAAKEIHDKYVSPPATTDFCILFLATEGLFAEVLRQADVVSELQRRYRVVLAGPTTLVAILNSLRMGFQTLAIEQRSSEVWRILGAVKTEFGKFEVMLDRAKKQLNAASRTLDQTSTRRRVLERKLQKVEQLSPEEASSTLALPEFPEWHEKTPGEGENQQGIFIDPLSE